MSLVDMKDAGGCTIGATVDVDGHLVPMLNSTPEQMAERVRGIPNIPIRDDDVIFNTYPKAGTHWGFEILSMLLQGSAERKPTQKTQQWLEFASASELEQQPSPRILNSHLPLEFYPRQIREKRSKMVVIMRNPKDVAVSFYHHLKAFEDYNYKGKFGDFLVNFMDGRVVYDSWFDYTIDIEKATENKDINSHIVYYEDLKDNGVAEIQKIAKFLEVDADEKLCEEIAKACSFQKMAAEKDYATNMKGKIYRKGVIGDWKNYFTVAQNEAFDKLFAEKMAASKFKFRFEAM